MSQSRPNDRGRVQVHVNLQDFSCPITTALMREPVISTCGHCFERESLDSWQQQYVRACPCPSCRTPITNASLYQIPMLKPLLAVISQQSSTAVTDEVVIDIELNQLCCPFTQLPLVIPVIAGCGHVFDVANVLDKRHREGSCHCPSCGTEVHLAVRNPVIINALLESLYRDYPHLLFTVLDGVLNNDEESIERIKHYLLRWFIKATDTSEDGLNVAATSGDYPGETAASLLIRYGLRFLILDPELRHRLSTQGLEAVSQVDGISGAWLLMSIHEGRQLVDNDAELRSKLSARGLNIAPQQGPYAGMTGMHWLAASSDLLIKYKTLRDLSSAEGLNSICQHRQIGTHAFWWLLSSDEGMAVFAAESELRAKLTVEGLNSISLDGPARGASVLYWLMRSEVGRELVYHDASLQEKITEVGLNTPYVGMAMGEEEDPNVSPLRLLLEDPQGIDLLCRDEVLRGKISQEGLNAIDMDGISVLSILAASQAGQRLLLQDIRLRSLVSERGLNAIITAGPGAGMSAAAFLAKTLEGKQLLADNNFAQWLKLAEKPEASAPPLSLRDMPEASAQPLSLHDMPEASALPLSLRDMPEASAPPLSLHDMPEASAPPLSSHESLQPVAVPFSRSAAPISYAGIRLMGRPLPQTPPDVTTVPSNQHRHGGCKATPA